MGTALDLDDERRQILLSLLTETNLELRAWRESSWIAFRDAVAAVLGIAGISIFRESTAPVLFIALAGIGLAAHIYLRKNFERYSQKIEARGQIELALHVYDDEVYLPDQPLFPEAWKNPHADKRGSYTYIWTIWIIASLTAVAVVIQWYLARSAAAE